MTPKILIMVIASILVVCSATAIVIYISSLGFVKIGSQSVRFALTCALSASLIRGWSPGRWIAVTLMGLGGIGSIVGGVNLASAGHSAIGLISMGAIYSACAIGLLTPFAGRHFGKNSTADQ